MIPMRQKAEDYLREAARLNPGPWEQHSRYVALGAEIIASHHPRLDAEQAYVLGLLHDIGRRFGKHGMRHVIDGYNFLINEGYPEAGRICLTHAYPIRQEAMGASTWDGSELELQYVRDYLRMTEYDDYDRLIQLCDAVTLPAGFCLMEKRMVDVVMRYGVNQNTYDRWKGYFSIKHEIEETIGISIYHILPGVIENTFMESE